MGVPEAAVNPKAQDLPVLQATQLVRQQCRQKRSMQPAPAVHAALDESWKGFSSDCAIVRVVAFVPSVTAQMISHSAAAFFN